MSLSLAAGALRWTAIIAPRLSRTLQNRAALRPIPPPSGAISTPHHFLKAIGRSSETLFSPDSWDAFWQTSGLQLRKAGLAVKERRYILWCMEKFRQGQNVSDFAHNPKPKKKVRGRGPRVQNGKLIRSRRRRQ